MTAARGLSVVGSRRRVVGALAVIVLIAVGAVVVWQRGSDDAEDDVPGFSAVQMVSPTTVYAGGRTASFAATTAAASGARSHSVVQAVRAPFG